MPPVVNICEVLITSRDVIAPTLRTVSQIIYRGGQELNYLWSVVVLGQGRRTLQSRYVNWWLSVGCHQTCVF